MLISNAEVDHLFIEHYGKTLNAYLSDLTSCLGAEPGSLAVVVDAHMNYARGVSSWEEWQALSDDERARREARIERLIKLEMEALDRAHQTWFNQTYIRRPSVPRPPRPQPQKDPTSTSGPASISYRLRYLVLKRDKYRCQLCGKSAADGVELEVDHKVARAKGGSHEMNNLWTLCWPCNRGKLDLEL